MFPSKSMVDYMTEMNRLFTRTESENAYSLAAQSPYNSTINRSSSSTDSTSPDSFPDITTFQMNNLRPVPETSRPVYNTPPPKIESQHLTHETPKTSNTPLMYRRQRPIVGRKILTPETHTSSFERVQVSPVAKIPEEDLMWSDEPILFQHTPPNVHNIYINNTNVFYDLFPNDNKGYDFKTPVKTSPTISSNISPTLSTISPTLSTVSPSYSRVPTPMFRQRSPSLSSVSSVNSTFRTGSARFNHHSGQKMCTFCKKNGETPIVYMTHSVKECVEGRWIVSCPILRSHKCTTCGASGDNAHTITYCPVLRSNNNGRPMQSTTITLKNTRIKSNGRRRF